MHKPLTLSLAIAVTSLGGLSGCATLANLGKLSEAQCAAIDWTDRGYSAGRDGLPMTGALSLATECQEFGFAPDVRRAEAGYRQGVRDFCTPAGVLEASLTRPVSLNVCEGADDRTYADLRDVASLGDAHRVAEARYAESEAQLDALLSDIEDASKEIRRREDKRARLEEQLDAREADIAEERENARNPRIIDPEAPRGQDRPQAVKNAYTGPSVEEMRKDIRKQDKRIRRERQRLREARAALPDAEADVRISLGVLDDSTARLERLRYDLGGR